MMKAVLGCCFVVVVGISVVRVHADSDPPVNCDDTTTWRSDASYREGDKVKYEPPSNVSTWQYRCKTSECQGIAPNSSTSWSRLGRCK